METKQTAVEYFLKELANNAKLSNSFNDSTWLIDKQRVIEIFNHCKILEKMQEHELLGKGYNAGSQRLEVEKNINDNYEIKLNYGN